MQDTQIGHFAVIVDGKKYSLTPTLRNMAKLADARRLIVFYDMIHSQKVPDHILVDLSREIILACSDSARIDENLIKCKRGKPHITPRSFSANDQVVVAAGLMRHGIAGVNRPRNAGTGKSSREVEEFDVNKIVADAMIHFEMSRKEALDLTMSEFYLLVAAKFPPESSGNNAPSVKAHNEVMEADKDMYAAALKSLEVDNG